MFTFIAVTLAVIGIAVAAQKTVQVVSAVSSAISNFSDFYSSAEYQESKKRLIPDKSHIIGLQSPRLVVKPTTLTTTKFDTTTYPDRAIITLTNSTGADIVCTGISIQGKVVYQFDGAFQWDYKDYNSIEKMGEKPIEISNRFIFSAEQTESLGDYITKELAPHSMYTLHIPGCLFCYDVGDVWHLAISYTINGQVSEAELIDTDVEVTSASFSRSVGGIGETLLQVRVPSGTWTKTTSRRARLISAGMPQNLYNRGNVLTIASATWTGQADYFCDGTDDDVEIQDAIDVISSKGGGEVYLTEGEYTIGSTLTMKDNVWVHGSGSGTIIKPFDNSVDRIIDWGTGTQAVNTKVSSIIIDGDSSNITYTSNLYVLVSDNVSPSSIIEEIIVRNFDLSGTALFRGFLGFGIVKTSICDTIIAAISNASYDVSCFSDCDKCIECKVINCEVDGDFTGFGSCREISSSSFSDNTVSGTLAGNLFRAFVGSSLISSCTAENNTYSGANTGSMFMFSGCNNISNCVSQSNTSSIASVSVTCFSGCNNMNNCLSSSNTTTGAATHLYSYDFCTKLSNCATASNVATGNEYGFRSCTSVQQCDSSGDSNPYTTSYADAASTPANACADTSAGGFNS